RELQRRELRDQRGWEAQLSGIISTRVLTAGYLFVPGQSPPKIEYKAWADRVRPVRTPVPGNLCFVSGRLAGVVSPDRGPGSEIRSLAISPGNVALRGDVQIDFAQQCSVLVSAGRKFGIVGEMVRADTGAEGVGIKSDYLGGNRVDSVCGNAVA